MVRPLFGSDPTFGFGGGRMAKREQPDEPRELGARIRDARGRTGRDEGDPRGGGGRLGGFGVGMRMAGDLVAALAVGVVIGLLLDRWLGTSPGFLIGFIVVGAGAGMLNVYRTALHLEQQRKSRGRESRKED